MTVYDIADGHVVDEYLGRYDCQNDVLVITKCVQKEKQTCRHAYQQRQDEAKRLPGHLIVFGPQSLILLGVHVSKQLAQTEYVRRRHHRSQAEKYNDFYFLSHAQVCKRKPFNHYDSNKNEDTCSKGKIQVSYGFVLHIELFIVLNF